MKSKLKLIFFAVIFFPNLYCQNNKAQKEIDLSSSLKSFEMLTNVFSEGDTIKLKLVVTEKAFKSFNFKNLIGLQELGLDWKNKKVTIVKTEENEQILKVEDYYVPLKFVRDKNGEWKFSNFSID